ncbi:gliding motility lipoprotein GldD [Oceanihabitans sp. IOP_32]|uniref:gliding motility lipoprotein GldD n=1 Tax=Oceanihabitans sp. IOP_32 TaxID=2529032 RepID=UPI001293BADA|nr:gliding motility lipoprotein GldD [Oceanihabitans sp. IOP_32]QFZ54744.1 gliding motility lipoprotein GldD [Oceanihabitans sp. IOP_32]
MAKFFYLLLILSLSVSCREATVPKPKAYLRLDYPKAEYVPSNINVPFTFEVNTLATKVALKPIESNTSSYGVNLEYPTLKGTIFLTYKAIENDRKNLITFLRDAQNFTQKHNIKADGILETVYESPENNTFGMFYEVEGNAASQAQFYVTDSTRHFLTGSLYFYAKPNYDSILPAAHYLQKDIKHIMETVRWR